MSRRHGMPPRSQRPGLARAKPSAADCLARAINTALRAPALTGADALAERERMRVEAGQGRQAVLTLRGAT